ncbi:MAG: hydrolase [Oscillibacter sp.]|nr:hydrolase [Oscillibacter sp.]
MEQIPTREVKQQRGGARVKRGASAPLIALGLTAVIMAGAYLGLCAWGNSRTTFYPHYTIGGVDVGGLTAGEAAESLAEQLPQQTILVHSTQLAENEGWPQDAPGEGTHVTLERLGYTAEQCPGIAQRSFEKQQAGGFLAQGRNALSALTALTPQHLGPEDRDADLFDQGVAELAEELRQPPQNGRYEMEDASIRITKPANGLAIDPESLAEALEKAIAQGAEKASVSFDTLEAQPVSVQQIHDEVAGEMKNAGYDAATNSIIPEQPGADFDVAAAQKALNAAAPGETVTVPAQIQQPEITAEDLKAVLFRDLLGECTTHVGGTAARINNVRLASAAFDGTVLNSGDVFSYNGTVGQRTAAKGYKAAPAYVQGETVDEIGGGVCQPSSTLYYACLLSNMEITERYAHRYIPAYITRGMDATVSWGGPDYKFTNNTAYPVRISAKYSGGNLTVQLWGTKTDHKTVKMTYETLSTTPFEEVEQVDPSLAPGQRQVKVTPYTGYRVRTFRNVYEDGVLVSSELEDISDYKSRNRLVLVGPAADETEEPPTTAVSGPPAEPDPTEPNLPVTQPPVQTPEEVPVNGPAEVPAEPAAPEETPPAVVVLPPAEE